MMTFRCQCQYSECIYPNCCQGRTEAALARREPGQAEGTRPDAESKSLGVIGMKIYLFIAVVVIALLLM